jgi:3-oxoacyl-[acyl-carrier protein] reductase
MDMGLEDRVAIVCGASRGLGRAVAGALAAEGASLSICARTPGPLEEAAGAIAAASGRPVLATPADVASAADLRRLVDATLERYGRIDVLVTNTGGPARGRFFDCDDEAWETSFTNTLLNVVRLVRLCVPAMKERGFGRIVNIASTTVRQPLAGLTMSNALRPAIAGLAKDLADELGPHGILINNVCPGLHATERLLHVAAGGTPEEPEARLAELARRIPLGRVGRPEELAATVVFLASERASYVTGTSVLVDGGATRGL